jgi:hypothetical protein
MVMSEHVVTLRCRGWQSTPLDEPTPISMFSFQSKICIAIANGFRVCCCSMFDHMLMTNIT